MTEPTALTDTHIGIVGTGVMAESILAGLLRDSLVDPAHVTCSHPRPERRRELEERYHVATTARNASAISGADVVVLGIKPQMLGIVMSELRGSFRDDQLVISILAGATTTALVDGLGHRAIVRVMPNTPAQIGAGVMVWFATAQVDEIARDRARTLLRALGREFEVADERQVAMATALSGTGPTYVFLFVEALIDAGVHLGFPRHIARELVLDTLVGSGEFALQSGHHMAALRDMVTSPGGTSADALYELESGRLRTVISDAVWAAYGRTLELEARLEGRDLPPGTARRMRG